AAHHPARAGEPDRIAAREGSPQGQPDAEPREYGQPHVAPGASGDLLRPSLHAGRDAGRHRARDGSRCVARGRRVVRRHAAGGDRAGAGKRRRVERGDADAVIPRYTNPEMGAIWTEQRRFESWLAVELAATDVMADAGIVPAEAA